MAVGMGVRGGPGPPWGLPTLPSARSPAGYRLPEPWSFSADELVGFAPLGPVAPFGFGYTVRLSGFGNASVSIPVTAALPAEKLRRLWSWRLWAYYGGRPVGCWIPTGVADEARSAVELTMTELTGYLRKRVWDYHPSRRYTQVEQIQIAYDIAAPVLDVGARIVTEPGGGFLRDRLYEYLESGSRAELLGNLSGVISGPEFRTEYGRTLGGAGDCILRIAYPRVGGDSGLGATVPGEAIGYRGQWDADKMRTRTFAAGEVPEGAAEGTPKPVAVVNLPQPDLPRLDEIDDWPATTLLSTLTERANTASQQYASPVLQTTVTETLADPVLTGYAVGDDVAVRIITPLMPGGLDATGRLTELSVSAGEGTATWTVAFALPAPRPRETLARRLDRLDYLTAAARRRGMAPL